MKRYVVEHARGCAWARYGRGQCSPACKFAEAGETLPAVRLAKQAARLLLRPLHRTRRK